MCGIVGYSGNQNARDIIIDGLSKLEYRGYDSSGIAVVKSNHLSVKKNKGRLKSLVQDLKKDSLMGTTGIGHTRWATHGKPSDENAHPHFNYDNSIAVVHNGIIENYQSLKEELEKDGIKFKSQTDTEVIPNLIAKYYETDLLEAVRKAVKRLKGSYALAVISKYNDDELVAVRKDSPLIVGFKDNESFIASDIPALLKYTRDVYFLENNEMVHIDKSEIKIYNENNQEVKKNPYHVNWDIKAAEKNGYSCFMEKEIFEQPKAIKDTFFSRLDENSNIVLDNIEFSKEDIKNIDKIYITACGTAYNAGLIGKNILQEYLKMPVFSDIASEFRYSNNFLNEKSLLITLSQSGETADTLESLRLSIKKQANTLSITNAVGSSIARESKNVLYTLAGPEIAVASTKAYTSQILSMLMIGLNMAKTTENIDNKFYKEVINEISNLPEKIKEVLKNSKLAKEAAKILSKSKNAFYIGRGLDYYLAKEGSLKLKEVSYIHSEAIASGELKHGTIALIEKNTPVIAIATDEKLLDKNISNIQEVKSRGGYVISIALKDFDKIKQVSDMTLFIPNTYKYLRCILAIVYMQLMALYTAQNLNLDIDKPRNLAKSVTVE